MGDIEREVSEEAIELNPELVRQRQDIYSSLTDLHGVAVFSDEFRQSIDNVVKQREEVEKQLEDAVFVEELIMVNDADAWLQSQLFCEQEELVLSQNYTRENTGLSLLDIGVVLIAVFAVAALYLFLFSDKRTRSKKL